MIWEGPRILVGRLQPPRQHYEWVWQLMTQYQDLCQRYRSTNAAWAEFWDSWNVMGMVVENGRYKAAEFYRFEELGRHPTPWLTGWWRYLIEDVQLQRLVVPPDPPVLHGSSQLVDPKHSPADLARLPLREQTGAWHRLRTVEQQLKRLGLGRDLDARTHNGLVSALQRRHLALVADGNLTYRLERWTRPSASRSPSVQGLRSLVEAEGEWA